MELNRALRIQSKEVVAFVGGGGKTSAMFRLADELVTQGRRVVTTTTTRIFAAQITLAPHHIIHTQSQTTHHLIDSLTAESFRGEFSMYARPGHIVSAVNIPVLDFFDETGRFKPHKELEELLPANRSERYITYCGGGIAASGSAFVMTRLGFSDIAVYTASLQEWTADPANPMEVMAEKTP